MKKIMVGVLSAALVLGATSVFAGTKAGDKEVGASFSYSRTSTDDYDSNDLMIMATGSYFVTDAISVGAGVAGTASSSDNSDSRALALFAEPNYHFNTNTTMVPYAGVHAGVYMFEAGDVSESAFDYGAQVGVKSFISEAVALNTQVRYDRFEIMDSTINKLELNIGLIYIF